MTDFSDGLEPSLPGLPPKGQPLPPDIDLACIFGVPSEFPTSRFSLTGHIRSREQRSCFKAFDRETRENVFVKIVKDLDSQFRQVLDYHLSCRLSDPRIVQPVALHDYWRYLLTEHECGPRLDDKVVKEKQAAGPRVYLDWFVREYPELVDFVPQFAAIVKHYVEDAVLLSDYLDETSAPEHEWVRKEIRDLAKYLARNEIVVCDLIAVPQGAPSNNILVLPDIREIRLSDMEWVVHSPQRISSDDWYRLILGDLDDMLEGRRCLDDNDWWRTLSVPA